MHSLCRASCLPWSRRKHQYTSITDWTGGLYISPGFAGSRSGALIATAWASMVHLGEEGYLAATGGARASVALQRWGLPQTALHGPGERCASRRRGPATLQAAATLAPCAAG